MPKICFVCGKVLSENENLMYNNQPICSTCLSQFKNEKKSLQKEKD